MEYKITKKECQDLIPDGFVCSQCGGELSPLETVDNANNPTFWSGCDSCCRFDHGVSKERYKIAEKLVDDHDYKYYSHIEYPETATKEELAYKRLCQISGACYIVRDVLDIQKKIATDQE